MKSDEVSRRFVVGALGVGVATAAAGVAIGSIGRPGVRTAARQIARGTAPRTDVTTDGAGPVTDDPAQVQAQKLMAPLRAGDRLGRWTIEQMLPIQNGAASVLLEDAGGKRFQLDICARDESGTAPVGPGRSERFEIFLANSGDGFKTTHEEHGLAAMALAEVIRANEHHVDRALFQTQARRVASHDVRVFIT